MTKREGSENRSFWATLPGILAGIAALITAVAGILGVLYTNGAFKASGPTDPSRSDYISDYVRIPDSAIQGHNQITLSNVDTESCAQACSTEDGFICRSFDYNKSDRRCQLTQMTPASANGLKTNYPGDPWDHYVRPAPRFTK